MEEPENRRLRPITVQKRQMRWRIRAQHRVLAEPSAVGATECIELEPSGGGLLRWIEDHQHAHRFMVARTILTEVPDRTQLGEAAWEGRHHLGVDELPPLRLAHIVSTAA